MTGILRGAKLKTENNSVQELNYKYFEKNCGHAPYEPLSLAASISQLS